MYVITIWHSSVKENITYSKDTSYKDDTTYYLLAYFLSNGLYFVHNDLIVLFSVKKEIETRYKERFESSKISLLKDLLLM